MRPKQLAGFGMICLGGILLLHVGLLASSPDSKLDSFAAYDQ